MPTTTERVQRAPRQFLLKPPTQAKVSVSGTPSPSATALGVLVSMTGQPPKQLGLSRERLPLHKPYRKVLDSDVAAMRNTGPTGGTQPDGIVAALYLAEFVGGSPWAHIDICGTAWYDKDELWRRAGCSGFGARLLIELAMNFRASAKPIRH